VPDAPPVLIEPTAGGGGALASNAASLAGFLDAIGRDERIGICLDTCHMHASGHDMATIAGFRAALRQFIRAAGSARIGLVHVNDSRDAAGSLRDRHAGLGTGTIGREPFRALFGTAALRGVPLVVETTDEQQGIDIAELKALRDVRPGPARRGQLSST
jgi:deoxyribonuclease-4